ncbi:hypothetical protein [Pseudorhodobacter aquimaris]|uniref:hypothetical protein n=1 Tax=Pseudorhodobacter aquimaris TaxID=687412 RepID=UPI000B0F76B8|nr:hypothetical protein [Pseudorhodobacter aquimaris]
MTEPKPNEKVTVLGSDGIHTRIHRQPLKEDGTRKDWDGPPENPFWDHIEGLMKESKETLIASGYPDPDMAVKFTVGLGWIPKTREPTNEIERDIVLVADKDPIEGRRLWEELGKPSHGSGLGDVYAMNAADVFSEEWYAGQIHHLCAMINTERENTYQGHLVRIFQIAEFEKDREWRRDFGLMIKRDIRGQKARKAGGVARKQALGPRTVQILKSMKEMSDRNISINQAAKLTFENGLGSSRGANQKLWTRNKRIFNP